MKSITLWTFVIVAVIVIGIGGWLFKMILDKKKFVTLMLPIAKDIEKSYNEAMYGDQSNMPSIFRDDLPPY